MLSEENIKATLMDELREDVIHESRNLEKEVDKMGLLRVVLTRDEVDILRRLCKRFRKSPTGLIRFLLHRADESVGGTSS